ncbi:DedA family protein [Sphingomonas sp. AOB5]|uniref:YqaA family protein n=1 Tax=Sphingomonas sp. AOB5 TaxID=3034017 RepID=UPI0023F6B212|nr:YqaA family protein [Sphingomonas sp. AOB5]MDF7775930.1 DedA family protein [Sphingomonas sp. AOB5]
MTATVSRPSFIQRMYNWTMEKSAHPHAEFWLALVSFVEASFFPIPPHPLLGLMCLANPKRAVRYAIICTLASVAGGAFGYSIGYFLYESLGMWLLGVLGLTKAFPPAACYLREFGVEIILIKGATPIPFKLLTITAGFIHMNFAMFMLASLASRAFSFMLVGILFRLFGAPIKAFIDKYLVWVAGAFAVAVIAGFLAIGALSGDGVKKEADKCSGATLESIGLDRK